jgi:hypothetical protein
MLLVLILVSLDERTLEFEFRLSCMVVTAVCDDLPTEDFFDFGVVYFELGREGLELWSFFIDYFRSWLLIEEVLLD